MPITFCLFNTVLTSPIPDSILTVVDGDKQAYVDIRIFLLKGRQGNYSREQLQRPTDVSPMATEVVLRA